MTSGEHEFHPSYLKVARFLGEKPAGRAYRQAEELLYRSPTSELSAYRFHLNRVWHVAILGDPNLARAVGPYTCSVSEEEVQLWRAGQLPQKAALSRRRSGP